MIETISPTPPQQQGGRLMIDETWWKVTRLVIDEAGIRATLARVAFFIDTEGLGDDAEPLDATADDPDAIEYGTGEHVELSLSDSADMLHIGEIVKCTLDRVVRS